ncbi:hypothetical protein M758_3G208000 [Ceratodon purpureus]|uniref:Uncharacterized protein n=1 Tax=Ceratodon purpureus TaxID=3225 RepID=A0A8T0IKU8_CERPU|nr:hypothetical protein KC19_3G208200 [Ceratodon purpureus]KAG0623874.1 hypothetical protein M758_3G208000 [Ceratodon purpureus]
MLLTIVIVRFLSTSVNQALLFTVERSLLQLLLLSLGFQKSCCKLQKS